MLFNHNINKNYYSQAFLAVNESQLFAYHNEKFTLEYPNEIQAEINRKLEKLFLNIYKCKLIRIYI